MEVTPGPIPTFAVARHVAWAGPTPETGGKPGGKRKTVMAITDFARTGTPQHEWLGSMAELAPEGDCHDQDSPRTVRRARPAALRAADRGACQRQQAHRGGTRRVHGRRDQPVPRGNPEQGAC